MKTSNLLATVMIVSSCVSAAQKNDDPCQLANSALAAGRYETAQTAYEACIKQAPPTAEVLSNLAISYAHLGRSAQAIATYRQALALEPENSTIHLDLGLALMKAESFGDAAREFASTLAREPDNEQAEELLALCHYQLKQYDLAAVEAERVHIAKPQEASAAFLLGSAYLRLHRYNDAIPMIDFAMRRVGSAEAHAILGEAYFGARSYREAISEFAAAEKIQSDMPGLHSLMGDAYAASGDRNMAVMEYTKELEHNPSDFRTNYVLGRLELLNGKQDEARKYLTVARTARPDDPSVLYEFGVLAVQDKDYAQAVELLQRVVEKAPNNADAHVLLAQAYLRTHRRVEGMREKAIAEKLREEEQAREATTGKPDHSSNNEPLPIDSTKQPQFSVVSQP